MNRFSTLITTVVLAGSAALAQQPATEAAALKASYNGIKNNLSKMAAKMPEDAYSFKATPELRTFGAVLAHVIDSQGRTCAAVAGASMPESAASKSAKADLVAAMKASFDVCDGVFSALSDEDAGKTVSMGRGGPRSKFAVLWGMIAHDNEQYGYLSIYLRLKGIVPPSSEPRQ
ncbi:MAG: DinB family protein [Acidobacteriia bacterium]|nr:DinB family protein [Terriglobia bacterium]